MAEIIPLGDPRLRRISAPVAPDDAALGAYCSDLAAALHAFRSAHGWGRAVALPQLGIARRVIVVDAGAGPFFVVNPEVHWLSPELFEVWDDCMCLPDIAVRVRRHRSMTVGFLDEQRRPHVLERIPESLAELLQHEIDHLDGIVLTDRMLPDWGVVARTMRERAAPVARYAPA